MSLSCYRPVISCYCHVTVLSCYCPVTVMLRPVTFPSCYHLVMLPSSLCHVTVVSLSRYCLLPSSHVPVTIMLTVPSCYCRVCHVTVMSSSCYCPVTVVTFCYHHVTIQSCYVFVMLLSCLRYVTVVSSSCSGTHLNLDVPAVDNFHDANHVIKHQTHFLTVICQRQ